MHTVSPSRRHRLSAALLLLPALLLFLPGPGEAQQGRSVEWTETSQLELPGSLGILIRALPGISGERESHHALYQSGGVLVSVDGSSTTILDLEERRWVAVDHGDESYVSMSFEESAAAMREMVAVMDSARAGAEEALREAEVERDAIMAEMHQAMAAAQSEFTFRVNAETTGRTETINGLRAQQHFLTTEVESTGGVEGVEDTDEGTLAFVVELWQSDEFPQAEDIYAEWTRELESDPAFQQMAEEMAESMEPVTGGEGWEALAMWNPGVAAGIQQLAEAMEALDGTTIRSVTHIAFVPRGVSLDRGELMAWEPDSMGDQLRGQAGAVAQEAARDAARSALRGATRGFLGRGGGDDPAPEVERTPVVRPLLRMTREKENIRVGPADPSLPVFQIPEGYQQRALPDPRALIGEG